MAEMQIDVNVRGNNINRANTGAGRAVQENGAADVQKSARTEAVNVRQTSEAASRNPVRTDNTAAASGNSVQVTGRSQYGQRTRDIAGNMTDTTREGIALEVRPDVRFENADGRVIAKQEPWSAQDEKNAGMAMARQAAQETQKRTEQMEAQREAVQQTNSERREQLDEAIEKAAKNREEEAVARVRAASSSVGGDHAAAAVVEEQAENAPTTYSGISETDLQRMVRDGEISQNDYDQEMEAREEQQEAAQKSGRQFNTQMTQNMSAQERAERAGIEIRGLGEDNEGGLSPQSRAQILQAAENEKTAGEDLSTARAASMAVSV